MSRRAREGSDLAGAIADLGVMVPLAAALIATNGLDASAVFVSAGLLAIGSGLYFGIPFPVQPLKALTAVAVAQQLSPAVIHAAGLEIAALLLVLSVSGVADAIAKVFTRPVVRALQLGVGVLLVVTAVRLVTRPPDIFRATPAAPWPLLLCAFTIAAVWWASRTKRYVAVPVLLVAGAGFAWLGAAPVLHAPSLDLPSVAVPAAADFGTALLLLVVPQLPLTFGNAVVGVVDVARSGLGDRARRVTPSKVCISCGAGNVISALLGGMPMCHGAGGLTAHMRLGARTPRMNIGLGVAFLVLGLLFGDQVPALLGTLPVWALAGFLAYAGVRHALLVADLRGTQLGIAVVAGGVGAWQGSLAYTVAIALGHAATVRILDGLSARKARPGRALTSADTAGG